MDASCFTSSMKAEDELEKFKNELIKNKEKNLKRGYQILRRTPEIEIENLL